MNTQPIKKTETTITFDNGDSIVVKKLALRKYAELLNALDKLPMQLERLDQSKNEEILSVLPKVIAGCLDEVINVVAIATDMEKSKIEDLSLDEVVKLLLTIIEVNKYAEVYEDVKKLFARPAKQTQ